MAFPIVQATEESNSPIAETSHIVKIPGGVEQSDLVIIHFGHAQAVSLNALTDWTELVDVSSTNAEFIIYRYWDSSPPPATIQLTTSGNTKGSMIAWRISGAINAPEHSTVATGTSTSPNATTCTPTGGAKDYLWISVFNQAGEEADDDTWCTAAPPSPPVAFTNLLMKSSGTAGAVSTNCQNAGATANLNAASLDAGSFTTVQSLAWRAYTIAIHPAPPIFVDDDDFPHTQFPDASVVTVYQ